MQHGAVQSFLPHQCPQPSPRSELLGEHQLTVESCDNRERELRDAVQAQRPNARIQQDLGARMRGRPSFWVRAEVPAEFAPRVQLLADFCWHFHWRG